MRLLLASITRRYRVPEQRAARPGRCKIPGSPPHIWDLISHRLCPIQRRTEGTMLHLVWPCSLAGLDLICRLPMQASVPSSSSSLILRICSGPEGGQSAQSPDKQRDPAVHVMCHDVSAGIQVAFCNAEVCGEVLMHLHLCPLCLKRDAHSTCGDPPELG